MLFLDFDGVVHPNGFGHIPTSWEQLKPRIGKDLFLAKLVARVNRICEQCNAPIVISSSWRDADFGYEHFNNIFTGHIIGRTPYIIRRAGEIGGRQKEIHAYLEAIRTTHHYAIIDDQADIFFQKNPRLFLTDPNQGLSEEMTHQIIVFLNSNSGPPDPASSTAFL